MMKERIRNLLEDALPLVDFDSEFLFSELDSLGVTTIFSCFYMMSLVLRWSQQMRPPRT